MRSYWIRMGPKSNMTGVLTRRGKFAHRHTHRGQAHEDGDRDWSDEFTSQGMPRIASYHQNREGQEADSPLESPKGTNCMDTFISDFWDFVLAALTTIS